LNEAKNNETDTVLLKRNSGSEAGGTKKLHKLAHSIVVKAMILDRLGFVDIHLYMYSQYFEPFQLKGSLVLGSVLLTLLMMF
jgi:hypothetical protein